ncbi:hypothetical protein J5N97_007256 [Dioscorea zingiberensis]|uniref:GH18 domain-containing protein n=1 Tax=Dioscorea zingiberensis TaxID=325984 RepID=A0A9D5DDK3_9LILI|nr:hypothetical protein J5N97_007256 [Dioscorea zingiberensis]
MHHFILLIILALTCLSQSQQQCINSNNTHVRAGYWFSNSNHYSPVSQINTTLYTHLYYYSLSVDETNFLVTLPPEDQLPIFNSFSSTLKSNNPSLKTLFSIGTDEHENNASNSTISTMASDPTHRAVFINSTLELARAHGFDGLDLAWQYPSSQFDMANLGILLAEWRDSINEEAKNYPTPLLLTATVYFSGHLFQGSSNNVDYPIDAISNYLDWANAICFNYHKDGEVTGADAALFDRISHFSTSYGIVSWLDAGIPPCKLMLGIPLYGRTWFLKNKMKNGLGAQVVAAGPRLKLSNQTGIMAYFEIAELLEKTNSAVVYDNQTVSAYFNNGGLWVTFDSLEIIEEKIDFALQNGLLGYFLWPISFDTPNYTVSKQGELKRENFI